MRNPFGGLPVENMRPLNSKQSPCYSGGNVTIDNIINNGALEPTVIRGYHAFQILTAGIPTILFEENNRRGYLLIYNRGPGNLFISFGQAPQGASLNYPASIVLTTTDTYELDKNVLIDTVYVVSDQSNTIVSAVQGIWTPH